MQSCVRKAATMAPGSFDSALIRARRVLRQAVGGLAVPELCREHGISSATFYKWRAKYGGMDASMVSHSER